jgi:pantoate--beta-alanine ligase
VREPDGLALSTRNEYLTPLERAAAPVLYWSLLAGKRAVEEQRVTSVADVRAAMVEVAEREKLFQLEYAEAVDALSLAVPPVISNEIRLLIAGRIGKVRLIDNVAADAGEG